MSPSLLSTTLFPLCLLHLFLSPRTLRSLRALISFTSQDEIPPVILTFPPDRAALAPTATGPVAMLLGRDRDTVMLRHLGLSVSWHQRLSAVRAGECVGTCPAPCSTRCARLAEAVQSAAHPQSEGGLLGPSSGPGGTKKEMPGNERLAGRVSGLDREWKMTE